MKSNMHNAGAKKTKKGIISSYHGINSHHSQSFRYFFSRFSLRGTPPLPDHRPHDNLKWMKFFNVEGKSKHKKQLSADILYLNPIKT